MGSNFIFTDTSFFKAYIDPEDEFHSQALSIFNKLQDSGYTIVTSNYILDETFTLLRVRCGLEKAIQFKTVLEEFETGLKIIRVLAADEVFAWEWFLKPWSKLSFTDCTSFVLMKRLNLKEVAAFDNDFKRAGFKIVT